MTAGTAYQGGRGSGFGAGGGGGRYGGGGAASLTDSGGGGGSSLTSNLILIDGLSALGYNSADGYSSVSQTEYAQSGIGHGGSGGQDGGNGRVVIVPEVSTRVCVKAPKVVQCTGPPESRAPSPTRAHVKAPEVVQYTGPPQARAPSSTRAYVKAPEVV